MKMRKYFLQALAFVVFIFSANAAQADYSVVYTETDGSAELADFGYIIRSDGLQLYNREDKLLGSYPAEAEFYNYDDFYIVMSQGMMMIHDKATGELEATLPALENVTGPYYIKAVDKYIMYTSITRSYDEGGDLPHHVYIYNTDWELISDIDMSQRLEPKGLNWGYWNTVFYEDGIMYYSDVKGLCHSMDMQGNIDTVRIPKAVSLEKLPDGNFIAQYYVGRQTLDEYDFRYSVTTPDGIELTDRFEGMSLIENGEGQWAVYGITYTNGGDFTLYSSTYEKLIDRAPGYCGAFIGRDYISTALPVEAGRYLHGVIDINGNTVFPNEYDSISLAHEDTFFVRRAESLTYRFVRADGSYVTETEYDSVISDFNSGSGLLGDYSYYKGPFNGGGLCGVSWSEGEKRFGAFIDKEGRTVISLPEGIIPETALNEYGLAAAENVYDSDGFFTNKCIVDKNGEIAAYPTGCRWDRIALSENIFRAEDLEYLFRFGTRITEAHVYRYSGDKVFGTETYDKKKYIIPEKLRGNIKHCEFAGMTALYIAGAADKSPEDILAGGFAFTCLTADRMLDGKLD
ncbi:MAG: WG repeat-containing protein [Clostridia bacterium]|nr:WG repeat-containing protein [Clostridia bacterium]